MAVSDNLRNEWKLKLEEWHASRLKGTAWCRENGIAHHIFLYWRRKLKDYPIKDKPKTEISSSNFLELSDKAQNNTGITIEYREMVIRLSNDFDSAVFLKCINLLRGLPC